MPIYTYRCQKCDHEQDHLLKVGRNPGSCPKCGSEEYEKQLTAPGGLSFKGSGFYQTDYKAPCGIDKDKIKDSGCGGGCGCS